MTAPTDESRPRAEPLLPCPRCPVRLRHHDLVRHLWLQHRLLLDGQQAREPWDVIADSVRGYRATGDRQFLARCVDLAHRVDADHADQRLRELFAASSPGPHPDPFAEVVRTGSSLCPHCLALIALPADPPVEPVTVTRGRIAQRGFVVHVSEHGFTPWLTVATPRGTVYDGEEGSQRWTRRTALALFVWPPALVAVVLALTRHFHGSPPLGLVLLALGLAVLSYLYIRIRSLLLEGVNDRALNQAWMRLTPAFSAATFAAEESAFVAGLALASVGRGNPAVRDRPLHHAMLLTEKAIQADQATLRQLTALYRLAMADAHALGSDAAVLLARQISRCLEGALPLAFAEQVVSGLDKSWSIGQRARLRILVCERAFEAGFLVGDLVHVGKIAPALGTLLGVDQPRALARLRFLWAGRGDQPWAACGSARTVFELAAHPLLGAFHLEACPDLLLIAEEGQDHNAAVIRLCSGGVRCQETLLTAPPRTLEVKALKPGGAASYQLLVDDHVFWFAGDPERWSRRLQRWCHYFFTDFAAQADTQSLERTSVAATRSRAGETRPCPDCGRSSLPRRGDLGVPV